MSPYVSIIIPTKNAGLKFSDTIERIFSNKTDFEFEVIAVDSGSTDGTKDVLFKYPLRVIDIHPLSFSHGRSRNIGARCAKGEILVFITQDAVPENDRWLRQLVSWFSDENVAGVYGRQLPQENAAWIEKFFSYYIYRRLVNKVRTIDPENVSLRDIFFSNVNSAIRKSCWQAHEFDEELIMSEDQEWSKHMLLTGKTIVYDPDACVIHSHHYSLGQLFKRNFDSGMSLKGLVNAPLKKSISYELSFLKSGFSFLFRNRQYLSLLYFPVYEMVRAAGFTIGFNSASLPVGIKRRLSQNKVYWEQDKKNVRPRIRR